MRKVICYLMLIFIFCSSGCSSKKDNDGKVNVDVVYDSTQGEIEGIGNYKKGNLVTLEANPKSGYSFFKWSDGVGEKYRELDALEDVRLSAYFCKLNACKYIDENNSIVVENAIINESGENFIITPTINGVGHWLNGNFIYEPGRGKSDLVISKNNMGNLNLTPVQSVIGIFTECYDKNNIVYSNQTIQNNRFDYLLYDIENSEYSDIAIIYNDNFSFFATDNIEIDSYDGKYTTYKATLEYKVWADSLVSIGMIYQVDGEKYFYRYPGSSLLYSGVQFEYENAKIIYNFVQR